MKTTINLPDIVVQFFVARAQQRGQDFDTVVTEILQRELPEQEQTEQQLDKPILAVNPKSGLPMIMGGRPPLPGQELTPERLDAILLEQEVEWHREASRH